MSDATPPGGQGHLGADLSALLDGELLGDEETAARAHLAECPPCRDELAEVEATRAVLRGLPFVDPPPGFVDAYIGGRRRRRRRAVAAAALASVATFATLVVSGALGDDVPPVEPELEAFAAAHAGEPMGEPMAADEMDLPVPMVDRLARFERTEVHVDDEVVQITFADDADEVLTVFEGYGRLDEGEGWPGVERTGAEGMEVEPVQVEVGGAAEEGWMVHLDSARLLVVEVGDVVYALVNDGPGRDLVDAAADLPGGDDDGLADRTGDVVVRIGRGFSP